MNEEINGPVPRDTKHVVREDVGDEPDPKQEYHTRSCIMPGRKVEHSAPR